MNPDCYGLNMKFIFFPLCFKTFSISNFAHCVGHSSGWGTLHGAAGEEPCCTHEHPLEVAPSSQQAMLGWTPQTLGRAAADIGTGPAQHRSKPKPTGHAAAAGLDGWGNPASSLAAGASLNLHGKSQGFPRANSPAPRREHPILPVT